MSDFLREINMDTLNTARDSAGNIVVDRAGNIIIAAGVFYCSVYFTYPVIKSHRWVIEDSFGDKETVTFSPADGFELHDFPKYTVSVYGTADGVGYVRYGINIRLKAETLRHATEIYTLKIYCSHETISDTDVHADKLTAESYWGRGDAGESQCYVCLHDPQNPAYLGSFTFDFKNINVAYFDTGVDFKSSGFLCYHPDDCTNKQTVVIDAPLAWCNDAQTAYTKNVEIDSYIFNASHLEFDVCLDDETVEEATAKRAVGKIALTEDNRYLIAPDGTVHWLTDWEYVESDFAVLHNSNGDTIYLHPYPTNDNRIAVTNVYVKEDGEMVMKARGVPISYKAVWNHRRGSGKWKWGVGTRNGYEIKTDSGTWYLSKTAIKYNFDEDGEPLDESNIDAAVVYAQLEAEVTSGTLYTAKRTLSSGDYWFYNGTCSCAEYDADGYLECTNCDDGGEFEVGLSPVVQYNGMSWADTSFYGYAPKTTDSLQAGTWDSIACATSDGTQKTVYTAPDGDYSRYYQSADDAAAGVNYETASENGRDVWYIESDSGTRFYNAHVNAIDGIIE